MAVNQIFKPLDAVTATTTSAAFDLNGAKSASIMFTRADHSSGNTVFTVLLSLDGTTYIATNKLIDNVTNTNAQTLTRVASKTLSSNTSVMVDLDLLHGAYHSGKIVATETTDGTHSATVTVNYN